MSDFSHEEADSALADALWWFRGYSAARPTDEHDRTYALGETLLGARNWLKRLARGKCRLVGLDEHKLGIVLTEAEFEMAFDALRFETPAEEREKIAARLRRAFDQFNTERKAMAQGPDIPF